MRRLFRLSCFILLHQTALGQGQANIWYLGSSNGIDFNSGFAKIYNGNFPHSGIAVNPATASISDANGRLLFCSDGQHVWDRNNSVMPNGTGLNGFWCWQALIVQKPQSSQYFLFYSPFGLGVDSTQLYYSVIDMSLNNGLGAVTSEKNILLKDTVSAKLGSIVHQNGHDVWLISHSPGGNTFYAFLISATGISTQPIINQIGHVQSVPDFYGQIKPSPLGNRLAMSTTHVLPMDYSGPSDNPGAVEIFSFDNSNALMTNPIYFEIPCHYSSPPGNNFLGLLGLEFSASGKMLYTSQYAADNSSIFQMNICKFNQADIENSVQRIGQRMVGDRPFFQMQLAPDHRIYISHAYDSLSVIANPDLPGTGCGFIKNGFNIYTPSAIYPNSALTLPYFSNVILSAQSKSRFDIQQFCQGLPTTFRLMEAVDSVEWNFGDPAGINNSSKSLSPNHIYSNSGLYTARAILYSGCSIDTLLRTFQIYSNSSNLLGNDTTLCMGQTLLLSATIPGSDVGYLWQDNSQNNTFEVNHKGEYQVQVNSGGCTIIDSINVSYLIPGDPVFPQDTVLCTGTKLLLNAKNPGSVYNWDNGSTAQNRLVATDGQYWVNITSSGCVLTDTIECKFVNGPAIELGNDTTICSGQTMVLRPGLFSETTYIWNDLSTADTLLVKKQGVFWVRASENGCSVSDTLRVGLRSGPFVDLGKDTVLCSGVVIKLEAPVAPGYQYLWQDNSSGTSEVVKNAGTYRLSVTDAYQCTTIDSVHIFYKQVPVFDLGPDTTICNGQIIVLKSSASDGQLTWNTGSTGTEIKVTAAGVYWLKVSDSGCSKTDSLTVNYKPRPNILLTGDTTLCTGQQLLLQVSAPDANYLWQDGSVLPQFLVNQEGDYAVRVIAEGCDTTATVHVNYLGPPSVKFGADTSICMNDPLILDALFQGSTYTWQDGSILPEYKVTKEGTYSVDIINICGESKNSIHVSYENCACRFSVPNAFTPNHDGVNDVFIPRNQCLFSDYELKVFNRWGQMVFSSKNSSLGWDGGSLNGQQPIGTYVWMISYIDHVTGKFSRINGIVALIR